MVLSHRFRLSHTNFSGKDLYQNINCSRSSTEWLFFWKMLGFLTVTGFTEIFQILHVIVLHYYALKY